MPGLEDYLLPMMRRPSTGFLTNPPRPPGDIPMRANFMHGQYGAPGQNLVRIELPNGRGLTVHREAAPAFKGFLTDLHEAGAPLNSIGSYNDRNIYGTERKSQHAYGNAVDLNQTGRDKVSPEFRNWVQRHPEFMRETQNKWGIVSGADFKRPGPDLGHYEWSGRPVEAPASGTMVASAIAPVKPSIATAPAQQAIKAATTLPQLNVTAPRPGGGAQPAPQAAPARANAPASSPAGPLARSALAQGIINGYGPAGANLTTFREPATGNEIISGSIGGTDYWKNLGRTPGSAPAALKPAPAPAPAPAAAAPVPMPRPRPMPRPAPSMDPNDIGGPLPPPFNPDEVTHRGVRPGVDQNVSIRRYEIRGDPAGPVPNSPMVPKPGGLLPELPPAPPIAGSPLNDPMLRPSFPGPGGSPRPVISPYPDEYQAAPITGRPAFAAPSPPSAPSLPGVSGPGASFPGPTGVVPPAQAAPAVAPVSQLQWWQRPEYAGLSNLFGGGAFGGGLGMSGGFGGFEGGFSGGSGVG